MKALDGSAKSYYFFNSRWKHSQSEMSSMYPTLEDMKVHKIQQAQIAAVSTAATPNPSSGSIQRVFDPTAAGATDLALIYPCLMQEYMGLRFEPPSGPLQSTNQNAAALYPTGNQQNALHPTVQNSITGDLMVAPLTHGDLGTSARAFITFFQRCNAREGSQSPDNPLFYAYLSFHIQAPNFLLAIFSKGLFVQFVQQASPAALVGLRFGDQILQIDGQNMAGITSDQAIKILAKINAPRVSFVVRDRPFERTVTLHKDSFGHAGFTHDDGLIKGLVKDSSAARNGLLIDHYVLEVNGQNVVGLKSKQLAEVIEKTGQIVTLTIMPKFVYEHIVKCMSDSMVKKFMDRSIPEVY